MRISELIKLARPGQWAKNLFVALPMFFNGQLLNPECWLMTGVAFLAFSLMASAVYCLNDVIDLESDLLHPVKKTRPVAAGFVSKRAALIEMAILIIASLGCCLLSGEQAIGLGTVLGIYFVMNVAYCVALKNHAIIDVFIISTGFVLRLIAGGVACDIWLSPWIVLLTFLVALFLAFAKRRDDVVIRENTGQVTRENTSRYNLTFLNLVLGLIGAITMVCYIMYTISPEVVERLGSEYVYVTSIFVLAGILRYLQVAIVDEQSGSPTKILFHDRFIQCCVALWIMLFVIIIYL